MKQKDWIPLTVNSCVVVQKAAKGERLDSHTYLRQNLGLAFAGTLTLYYMWRTPAGVLTNAFHK